MRVYPNRFARRSAAGGCDEITENHLRTRCKHQLIQRLNEPDDRSLGRTSSRHVQVTYKSHRERHTHEYTTRHGHGSHTIRRRRCTEYSTNCYCEKRRERGDGRRARKSAPGKRGKVFCRRRENPPGWAPVLVGIPVWQNHLGHWDGGRHR